MSAAELNNSILFLLECPACLENMKSRIYLCLSGHSVCEYCWHKLTKCPTCKTQLSESRNYSLEAVAEELLYPCPNSEYGCKTMLRHQEIAEHVAVCIWRPYKCHIYRCKWEGRRHKLGEHFMDVHKKYILAGAGNLCYWKPGDKKHEVELIMAHNEYFYFHKKIVGKNLNLLVQYLGKPEDVIQYVYKISIFTQECQHRKIEMTETCQDDITDINLIIDSGYSITIPTSNMETFMDAKGKVSFRIEIIRV